MSRRAAARSGWILLCLVVGVGSAGCPRRDRVDLGLQPRKVGHDEYDRIQKRWTRNRLVIRTFDTVINATVTYLSAEFVSAYAARYAHHYRLTRAEHERWLAQRLKEIRSRHEFFLAVTTADRDWNDFDQKRSIWRIILEDDRGTRALPLHVRRLRVNEVHRAYFPYTSVFHRAYVLTFPRTVGGKPFVTPANRFFKLGISGPMGSASLVWFIKQDPKAAADPPPRARATEAPRARATEPAGRARPRP